MHEYNYKLVITPTESRVSYNANNQYTLRSPLGCLSEQNDDILNTILDTAKVAFGHNHGNKGTIVIVSPKKAISSLQWLAEALKKGGNAIKIREIPDTECVDFSQIQHCEIDCVDRRLNDEGADVVSAIAQISHAGAVLVLHPDLKEVIPPHHRNALFQTIKFAKKKHAPVNRLNYHFGFGNGGGCGMYKVLSSIPHVRETLQKPEDIYTMLEKVRDDLKDIIDPNCQITATTINRYEDAITWNLDDAHDRKSLFGLPNLVL